MRSSLPAVEQFSRNPRRIRKQNPVPVLSLLGLNNQNNGTTASTARAFPPPLPPLSRYPALKGYNPSEIKPLPGAPLRPAEVLQVFPGDLAPIELGEILKFRAIYYIGSIDAKPFNANYDSDYNDRKKQYQALPNDHIYYRYQVLSHAGGGAFSTVYRCFDHKRNMPVAVKIVRSKPDCLQYAEVEAKIQSELRGNHSVQLLASFFWRGHFCLVMELLYTDIYTIVEKRNFAQVHPNVVRHVTFQTLLCLRELAKRNIVHADIKPENILTNDDKLVNTKVADFGTACYTDQQIFTYIQSRYYRAPEVLYGLRYGPAIDMWSLGCVVYELLIGEPLYPAEDEEELAEMIEISIGPPPSNVYKKGSKWSLFPRVRYQRQGGRMEPIAFMVACLPRAISKFIRLCLVWDPEERLTPEQALVHEWILPEWNLFKMKQEAKASTAVVSAKPVIKEPNTARSMAPRRWHNK